ncbi:MAG: M20 aminoacylase family protein [Pseudomonadota bacterium]|jgi:hippurate hydrolase
MSLTEVAALNAATPSFEAVVDEAIALRRAIHRHPELAFHETRTSGLVADSLQAWGYEVTTGVGGTGVVGVLTRGRGTKRLGLRADLDALPVQEATGLPFASEAAGRMHACGHDGHTAILLAAARRLAEDGRFSGTLNLIFQPAEETGAGARKMIAEGLFERFPCDAIFGLHNWPGAPAGRFGFVEGPAMASVDQAIVDIVGKGGHGASPHETVDPIVASAHVITALQTVVSRSVDPLDAAVVTVGSIHGGDASNVIPDKVSLKLTIRTFDADVRADLQARIPKLIQSVCEALGASAKVNYQLGFPSVVNHVAETRFARQVAIDLFGPEGEIRGFRPRSASEDFAYFLEARPGAFLFLGNGEGEPLHNPRYAFNDAVIAPGAAFWVRLAETFLT